MECHKSIKLGKECLTDNQYKMLSEEAKQKIIEINGNADVCTIIELPEGLLFLNLLEKDVDEWNENVIIKVPPSILGYMIDVDSDIPNNLYLPSFLNETTISEFAREYYECKLPKREFRILGQTDSGTQLMYKAIKNEFEASKLTMDDFYDSHDRYYATIPIMSDYDGHNYWKLVFKNLELNLYSDDCTGNILVALPENDKWIRLIHSAEQTSLEDEFDGCIAVMARSAEGTAGDKEAVGSDSYDPRLLKQLGSYGINRGVWTLEYDDDKVDWGDDCWFSDPPLFYYYDGNNYRELELSEDVSAEDCNTESVEPTHANSCETVVKPSLFDALSNKLRNRWGLSGSSNTTSDILNYCRECGTKLEPGDKYCGNCGVKIR